MRTTVEIPDPLFKAAKRYCFDRGLTLRELVSHALTRELEQVSESRGKGTVSGRKSSLLPTLPRKGRAVYELSSEEVEAILLAEEIRGYGRSGRSG